MPSIHIPEEVAEPYILEHNGFEGGKQAIIETLEEHAPEV